MEVAIDSVAAQAKLTLELQRIGWKHGVRTVACLHSARLLADIITLHLRAGPEDPASDKER